ncbi:MAG: D-alanyl-D-alanine carboxypeptidase [Chloroflexi bacterium]|nr:D-alanyl-D-alanine carboxypeptidase [Chloroflexota bacterium]
MIAARPRSTALWLVRLLLGLLVNTGFGPPGYLESDEARSPIFARSVWQMQQAESPPLAARSAVVIDADAGTILYARRVHERLPMASMTKMMTALLAIERGQLDRRFTIQVDAADYPDSSLMGLRRGDRLSLEDLLYGLMLPSGNDAAVAVARIVSGSEAAFVAAMNRRAADLGLVDTHFVNPHGLDDPDHYSSAYDMARLAWFALRNPTFARIVATREREVKGSATYQLHNTNRLLFTRTDVRGVKTGTTDLAGRCVTAFAVDGPRRIITVVMNSPNYFEETATLIDHVFAQYTWLPIQAPPSPFYGAGDPTVTVGVVILLRWKAALVDAELIVDEATDQATYVYSLGKTVLGEVRLTVP